MSKSNIKRGRSKIDLKVDAAGKDASIPPGHPFKEVSERGREDSRLQVLGNVLAKVAQRAATRHSVNGKEDVQ